MLGAPELTFSGSGVGMRQVWAHHSVWWQIVRKIVPFRCLFGEKDQSCQIRHGKLVKERGRQPVRLPRLLFNHFILCSFDYVLLVNTDCSY